MSRISAIDPATADARAKPLLAAVQNALGMTPNLFRVAAHSPATLEGLLDLGGALGNGTFTSRLREAIALAVAEANQCDYCLSAHTALGRSAGLTEADIDAARDGGANDPKTAAIVRLASVLVADRGHVSDAELARVRRAGVTDAEIVETVANTVANIFTNYLNHVAETDVDFPPARSRAAKAA